MDGPQPLRPLGPEERRRDVRPIEGLTPRYRQHRETQAKPADQRAGAVKLWREYVEAGRHMSPDAVEDEPPAAQAAADGNVSPDRVEQ